MPEKLTLAVYLERRGAVKALTRIEAEVFGVQYPLVKGWAHRHGTDEITQAMLDQLQEKIGRARSSTAQKAMRGYEGATQHSPDSNVANQEGASRAKVVKPNSLNALVFPGFVARLAKRTRMLRSRQRPVLTKDRFLYPAAPE